MALARSLAHWPIKEVGWRGWEEVRWVIGVGFRDERGWEGGEGGSVGNRLKKYFQQQKLWMQFTRLKGMGSGGRNASVNGNQLLAKLVILRH